MPDKETLERAREDAREGKSPSTQAGEFVREEMESRRQTRRRVDQTGDCHWLIESAPRRGKAAATWQRKSVRQNECTSPA